MKRTAFTATALAITLSAIAQQPYTPPFSESFEEGLGEFIAADGNNDGNKIKANLNYGGGYNYSKGVYYVDTSDNGADDWLFTPALSLKAGMVYELSYWYKLPDSGKTYKVEWKAGTSPETSAMGTAVAAPTEYGSTSNSFEKITLKVAVPSDGDWYLGLHLTGAADQGTFYFDEVKVTEGVNASMPEAPEVSGPEFAVAGEQLHATFTITLPTQTVGGISLGSSPATVNILRSDKETATTLNALPGATVSYTDEDASAQRTVYTVTCTAGGIQGVAAEVESAPKTGTPKKIEGFTAHQQGNTFTLNWNPVTEATSPSALFLPAGVRYTVKCGSVIVADNTDKTTATYTADIPEDGQQAISFTVTAVLGSNQSETYTSPTYLVGEALTGEFTESFADYSYDNSGWTVQDNVKDKWMPSVGNAYPAIDPQDYDNGCLVFSYDAGKELKLYSPLLNLSSLVNPKLKFWAYLSGNPNNFYNPTVQPGFIAGGEEILLGEPIGLASGEKEGWTEFTFDLPAAALAGTSQLFFLGTGDGTGGKIYLDHITILAYLDHNLAVSAQAPAESFGIGERVVFPVTVTNKGANSESVYSVVLFANDEQVAEAEGREIAPSGSAVLDLPFTVLPRYAGTDVTFRALLDMASDMDVTDNEVELTVPVLTNDLAVVTGLTAESAQEAVNLSWTAPEVSDEPVMTAISESFETWDNGATEPHDGWVFIDADGLAQNGLNNLNNGTPFAAMVIENFIKNSWDSYHITAEDGVRCLAMTSLSSWNGTPDNWIVSPIVKGGSEFSFFSKTYSSYSTTQSTKFDILWSEGGTDPEDFTLLAGKTVLSGDWTECVYELPANARRFAIHLNGKPGGDALLFDSFSFTAMTEPAVHTGYNVYRNHELIATLPAETAAHSDTEATDGVENTYHVTALYDKGESAYSEPAKGTKGSNVGVDAIGDDTNVETEYYSLQGVRIASPAKGDVVIVRKGGKSYKTVIR